ncbi:Anthranilate phosphoribosyltransferase [Pseudonocardia dioxanivorans CB1190]|uniref:Anthranilate phosphoribosyltransferase n=1 Tax=Pseudonocardia dioxanivorans (strain ATCC 55486 / DSM 44775 / JCM 13855 / CB1190) TaxID=675635 RepID=F4CL30_PSEUX|nr:Anthranilate phosphoribosyltransferase [Pseudonocardia dioxanivorans CB1190]
MADVAAAPGSGSASGSGTGEARSWPRLLASLIAGRDLETADTAWIMDRVLSEEATAAQLAGFLVGLRAKGETAAEIAGLAEAMLARASRVTVSGPAVDIVGTGGDQAHTVNISTMAAVVVAAAGIPVVKHGNRAATSKCGAADLLQEVGVAIALPAAQVEACVAEVGIGFCFAPVFHPAMRHTAGPRAELGVPTAMNVLGPLTNPAQPPSGLVGCADARLAPVLAEVFASRGMSVFVVRGDDGLDELTTTTTSTVWAAGPDGVRATSVDPAALGVAPATREDLRGGDAAFNAAACHALLAGKHGPHRDAVLLNAAGALVAAGAVAADGPDLHAPMAVALERAAAAIDSGAAADLLARWAEFSTRLAPRPA